MTHAALESSVAYTPKGVVDAPLAARSGVEWISSRTAPAPAVSTLETRRAEQLALLNPTQRSALDLAAAHASMLSITAKPALELDLQGLGLSAAETQRVLDYLRDEASLHIYFNPQRKLRRGGLALSSYFSSGLYKNQFETRTSGATLTPDPGGTRDRWERILFRGAYHDHPLIPEERPKYAVLNAEGLTVPGASACYGDGIFVLKPEVKARTTITSTDTSYCAVERLGTPEYAAHVLGGLWTTKGMDAISTHVLGKRVPTTEEFHHYIEAQVHGPIDLARDVEQIVLHTSLREVAPGVRALSRKFNIPLFWNDGSRFTSDT